MHLDLEEHLPLLIEELSNKEASESIATRWASILAKFFNESTLQAETGDEIQYSEICDDGHSLRVPAIAPSQVYRLTTNGGSFFSSHDAQLADALHKLTCQFMSVQEAIEQGASEERQRIARDLHDDVAARILTLIHLTKDQQTIDVARSILKSLRNAIYTLDNKSTTSILDAVTDIRAELQERLNSIGMQLFWSQPDNLDNFTFTPRQHINLHRILHEVTTNVIRHAEAHYMNMDIELKDDQLHIFACDDGKGFNMDACIPGKGISNIKNRIHELKGNVAWAANGDGQPGTCLNIQFPISTQKSPAN